MSHMIWPYKDFQNYHLNFQFALSLISSGRFSRALMILDECILIGERDSEGLTRCIAAKIALFKLHDPHRALEYLQNDIAKQVFPQFFSYRGDYKSGKLVVYKAR